MSEMDKQLPPYFKEYLEQKFTELHTAIQTNKKDTDIEISELKNEQKWTSGMIKIAIGGLSVISIAGVVFLSFFKTLNKQQIQEAIKENKNDIANEVVVIIENKYNLEVKK